MEMQWKRWLEGLLDDRTACDRQCVRDRDHRARECTETERAIQRGSMQPRDGNGDKSSPERALLSDSLLFL
jgi:hypothetical protein